MTHRVRVDLSATPANPKTWSHLTVRICKVHMIIYWRLFAVYINVKICRESAAMYLVSAFVVYAQRAIEG